MPAVRQKYEDEEFFFHQDGAIQPYHRHLVENISSGRYGDEKVLDSTDAQVF